MRSTKKLATSETLIGIHCHQDLADISACPPPCCIRQYPETGTHLVTQKRTTCDRPRGSAFDQHDLHLRLDARLCRRHPQSASESLLSPAGCGRIRWTPKADKLFRRVTATGVLILMLLVCQSHLPTCRLGHTRDNDSPLEAASTSTPLATAAATTITITTAATAATTTTRCP